MDLFRKTIICFLIVIASMFNIMLAQTTNAINWKEDLKIYKKLFMELPLQLERDYTMGVFKRYQEYTTSLDVKIMDIDFAIGFNNYHEGIHLGVILGIAKLI